MLVTTLVFSTPATVVVDGVMARQLQEEEVYAEPVGVALALMSFFAAGGAEE